MNDFFQYDFIVHAIIASSLASIACGIIGTYVVVKRIVFIGGGIAHTAYGGIGLGFLLGFNPLLGAVLISSLAAVIIAYLRKGRSGYEDTAIGIMWALGMALGVLFINLSPGYAPDLMSYLFGNILAVPVSELFAMAAFDLILITIVIYFFKEFQAITFDEEFARILGLPVDNFYILLLVLIAVTVVLLIKLVGIILVIALITVPAAISFNYVKSLKVMMVFSAALGLIFTISGLVISYLFNLTAGAVIILLASVFYALSLFHVSFLKRRQIRS